METNVNFWNGLTIDEKRCFIEKYQILKQGNFVDKLLAELLENKFGKDVLEEKQIKTWEDVEDNYVEYQKYVAVSNDIEEGIINIEDKLRLKLLATYRISKLIELGYGGVVNEEEWKDKDIKKWCIVPCNSINDIQRVAFYSRSAKKFIAFHTEQQAKEFMSHESNRKLVEMYYCL